MRKLCLIIVGLLFIGYLAYEGRGLIFAPALKLLSPPENFQTQNHVIEVTGQTDPGAQITINGTPVLPDETGYFAEKLSLQDGLNVLEVKATKRYARPRVVERMILVSQEKQSLTYDR